MTRICINLCLDFLRKRQRQQTDSLDKMEEETGGVERRMEVEDYNPTEEMERSELRREIDAAMEKLSYEHRTVLVLHEFERWNTRRSPNPCNVPSEW